MLSVRAGSFARFARIPATTSQGFVKRTPDPDPIGDEPAPNIAVGSTIRGSSYLSYAGEGHMMKPRIPPAALAISSCVGLLLMSTATALAAPNDVIASVTVDGYTVSPTITNNWSGRIDCGFTGYIDPTGPGRTDNPNGDFGAGLTVDPGTTRSQPIVDPRYPDQHIPDGNYHVWWFCAPAGTDDYRWGTTPPRREGQATGNPIPVTVPSRSQFCIGSVCL